MTVIDALHAPWAIRPEMLQTMFDIYGRHERGEVADLKAIAAAIGAPLTNETREYSVADGVAVIGVEGVLSKRMDMFTRISGGASTQRLQGELDAALNDPAVHSIVLLVDSPGGEVDGTQALADAVFAGRDKKPIVALIDGMGASGAYWIASAASQVFITSDTTIVGSIGVVTAHKDVSRAEAMRGVKTTEITAGKYKRIAGNYAPLSAEGRDSLQSIVDHIYSVFVNSVARNRNMSTDAVLADMADGRVFLGQQAVDAGLVDGITTLDEVIGKLSADFQGKPLFVIGATAPGEKNMKLIVCGVECADQEQVTAAVTRALSDAKVEAHAQGKTEGKTEGITEGAKAERERVTTIQAEALPGHEALVAELINSGASVSDARGAMLKAEKEKRKQVGADLVDDAPKPVSATQADPAVENQAEPDPVAVGTKAAELVASEKKNGRVLSFAQAVGKVRAELGLK